MACCCGGNRPWCGQSDNATVMTYMSLSGALARVADLARAASACIHCQHVQVRHAPPMCMHPLRSAARNGHHIPLCLSPAAYWAADQGLVWFKRVERLSDHLKSPAMRTLCCHLLGECDLHSPARCCIVVHCVWWSPAAAAACAHDPTTCQAISRCPGGV